jgi:nucleoside diphosphate kinase
MHTSFVTHAGGRYFWIALAFVVISIIMYAWHDPNQTPNGGTWYGYTMGTIGALLIFWLLYLGRRKRNFAHGWGTVRGWVSAHVYFGTALLFIATLHTGFQFAWNIHTFAYVLMCLVIFSGFFGVWAYRTYPQARNNLKKSETLDDIFLRLEDLDAQLKKSVSKMADDVKNVVTSAVDRTEIGGGMIGQLTAQDQSKVMINGSVVANANQQAAVDWLVQRMSNATGEESQQLAGVVREYSNRQKLLKLIRSDIQMSAIQEIWLFFHVPMSFGLIAALIAHIVSVFLYW